MSDFVNIEKTVIDGKQLLMVNDSISISYVDPIDGIEVIDPNNIPIINESYESNIEMKIVKKPDMIVTLDNPIILNLQKYLLKMKNTINLDVTTWPMLIYLLSEKLKNLNNDTLRKDYLLHMIKWLNKDYFHTSYFDERLNIIEDIYQDILKVFDNLINTGMISYDSKDIPSVDNFIMYLLKNNLLNTCQNVFEAIVIIIQEVNAFPLHGYQKKLYAMNTLNKLSTRNIFSSNEECKKMIDSYYIFPNFIDTCMTIQKTYFSNQYKKKWDWSCGCLPIIFKSGVKYI